MQVSDLGRPQLWKSVVVSRDRCKSQFSFFLSCGSQLASAVWKQVIYIIYVYMTLFGVHEMYVLMHPNQDHVTNLFAVDPLSLFGYLTVSSTHPVTDN